jgi:hypothetical protein
MLYFPNRFPNFASPLSSAVDAALPADHSPNTPSLRNRAALACLSHAARDFAGQTVGRLLGLGVYSLLSTLGETPLRVASGIAGAGAGARLSYMIACEQIGTGSYSQCAAVGACTIAGTVIGGVIVGVGSNQIVSGLAAGALITSAISWPSKWTNTTDEKQRVTDLKTGSAIGVTFAGIGVASWCDQQWKVGSNLYPARNLGLIVESTVIEICKSSFEKLGPSVNRNALNFEGKVVASLLGMAPYVAATVFFNGYISGRMQPNRETAEFAELAVPMIVGAIANAVRGFSNALVAYQLHSNGYFVADDKTTNLRDHAGAQWPEAETVFNKSSIRYLLSACRNAVYARLRDSGMSVELASEIAQGVYACYAQCRDLIHDIARGEGWSEPKVVQRPSAELATA